jgi:hypothetical protein
MVALYILAAIVATLVVPAALGAWNRIDRARRAAALPLTLALLVAAGCDTGGLLDVVGGTGGGETTSFVTVGDCGGGCPEGQACGGGCATDGTRGCYTPGGNPTNPGHWDCPSCFRAPSLDGLCPATISGYPEAYTCQDGAKALGGCLIERPVTCCPLPPPAPDAG